MKFDVVVRRKEGEEKERREGERRKGQRAPRAGETENSKETEEKTRIKKETKFFVLHDKLQAHRGRPAPPRASPTTFRARAPGRVWERFFGNVDVVVIIIGGG